MNSLIILALFLILCKIYAVVTCGKCYSKKKLHGKTVLVTGSNRGIGYMTALNLAKRGARVIITSEDKDSLKIARKQMIRESGNTNIVAKHLDFLCLDDVRAFAEDIVATEERLDVLVNNAAVIGLGNELTRDGLLPTMQVNYFGPFLLTNLLLDLLKKSSPSRIINVVSSFSNLTFAFDAEDITRVRGSSYTQSCGLHVFFEYSNSKICLALATVELAERLRGTGVTVNCLHPGVVYTKIFYGMLTENKQRWNEMVGPIYYKTPEEGAETSVHLAVCESVEKVTGRYFSDCRESSLWADLRPETRAKVWNQTVRLVSLKDISKDYCISDNKVIKT